MKQLFLLIFFLATLLVYPQVDEQLENGTKRFGNAIAMDGDWAVVGNMNKSGFLMGQEYDFAGQISIYKKAVDGTWVHFQDINEPLYFAYENNPASPIGLYYGNDVDIHGSQIIVGAYAYDSDMQGNIGPDGMAFIYTFDAGANAFLKTATLSSEVAVVNSFGFSVAIGDTWAVVGDPTEQHPINGTGADRHNIGCAHVFKKVGGAWVYNTKLTASDGWGTEGGPAVGPGDGFGWSVDVEGNTVVVGATRQGVQNSQATGAVYSYLWDNNAWAETKLTSPTPEADSYFGASLALHQNTLVVGAPDSDLGANNAGQIAVFNRVANTWDAGSLMSSPNVIEISIGFPLRSMLITIGFPMFSFNAEDHSSK